MKEATLKKYNKTQLETYAKKAKDQIKFWEEQLELANKVLDEYDKVIQKDC